MASGGLNRYTKRAIDYAESMYAEIRKRHYDVINVARNTGFSIERVCMIKNYMFNSMYFNVDTNEICDFEPSYEIAESWRRLSYKDSSLIQFHDGLLMYHELYEILLLIQNDGMSQYEAHNKAASVYDYPSYSEEYYRIRGR